MFIVYDKEVRWCTCSLWRTLGKLIGLLFCLPSSLLLFVENSKNTRNELARPVMGTIFLVINLLVSERSERDTLRSVQSRIVYILEKWFPLQGERLIA